MKKILFIAVGLVLLLCNTKEVKAQQDPHYSMYIFNGMAINPAYAGSREVLSSMVMYRHQWAGINGNPKTMLAMVHAPLANDRVGLGFSLVNDNISIFNTTSFNFNYAYRIPVGEGKNKGKVAIGALATLNWTQASPNELQGNDAVDDAVQRIPDNTINPNFGFGAYYYTQRYFVGVSAPHLLNSSLTQNFDLEGTKPRARQYKHYFVTAGYVFNIKEGDFKIKPSFLLKAVQNAPISADFNVATLFYDVLWVGASYRYKDAVVMFTEVTLNHRWRIGYAYDFTLTDIQDYSNGSHEVMIGYEFHKEEIKIKTPRYF